MAANSTSRGNNKKAFQMSKSKLKSLVSKKHSSIREINHEMKVALSPKYLSSLRLGLKETLDKELFCYNDMLKGVPLGFDKVKILKSIIIDDQEFISFLVEVNFIVFKPEVGGMLYGIVNKIGDGHYGCLLHKCINASITKPKLKTLTSEMSKTLDGIEIDTKLLFQVTRLEVHHDILSVSGELVRKSYNHLQKHRSAGG